MSDCNCNSAPGQHKDDYTYHADNCPFFLYGRIAELEAELATLKEAAQKVVNARASLRDYDPCSDHGPNYHEAVFADNKAHKALEALLPPTPKPQEKSDA